MFTFGTDPEFVLLDEDGNCHSAIDVVPGTREHRHQLGKHEVFCDSVLAECAVWPGKSKTEVVNNLRDCFTKVSNLIRPYKLSPLARAKFPKHQLTSQYAKEAGCKDEICAYQVEIIRPPNDIYAKSDVRVAGGHIHLGSDNFKKDKNNEWDNLHRNILPVVRMIDLFLGIPSIYLDNSIESRLRKKLYGAAGRFRHPSHGIEYRTLSNFWLASPKLVGWVYDICDFAISHVNSGRHSKFWSFDDSKMETNPIDAWNCHGYSASDLQSAINNHDQDMGNKFLMIVENELPEGLFKDTYSLIESPSRLTRSFDFYKEWKL